MGAALTVIGAFALMAVAVLVWLRRSYVLVDVNGRSMEPTLRHGQKVLARRAKLRRVRHGDVVVLYPPPGVPNDDGLVVKRILALPGDPVPRTRVPKLRDLPQDTIPPAHLVVLGDNPAWSLDSRQLGLFPADRLLGVVLRRRRTEDPSRAARRHTESPSDAKPDGLRER